MANENREKILTNFNKLVEVVPDEKLDGLSNLAEGLLIGATMAPGQHTTEKKNDPA